GQEIPCVLTMMADEFGGPVPVGPFAVIGDDSIGRGIVETLQGHRSPAVLMQNPGPFTIGKHARAAGKAAVMVEEVARTVHGCRDGPCGRAHRAGLPTARCAAAHRAGPARLPLRPLPEPLRPALSPAATPRGDEDPCTTPSRPARSGS